MSAEMWSVGEDENKCRRKRKGTIVSCVGGSVGTFIGVMRG